MGHYTNKSSGTREGEATFYRSSRFRLSRKLDLSLKDCFKDILTGLEQPSAAQPDQKAAQRAQRAARHAQFKPLLQSSPHLSQVLTHVSTVAQITLLEPVTQSMDQEQSKSVAQQHIHNSAGPEPPQAQPSQHQDNSQQQQHSPHQRPSQQQPLSRQQDTNQHQQTCQHQTPNQALGQTLDQHLDSHALPGSICVVNSHFFFHPHASHVRNIHAAAIMSEVQAFLDDVPQAQQSCGQPNQAKEAAVQNTESGAATRVTAGSEQVLQQEESNQEPATPAVVFCGDMNCGLNHGTPGVCCWLVFLLLPCLMTSFSKLRRTGTAQHSMHSTAHNACIAWKLDATHDNSTSSVLLMVHAVKVVLVDC